MSSTMAFVLLATTGCCCWSAFFELLINQIYKFVKVLRINLVNLYVQFVSVNIFKGFSTEFFDARHQLSQSLIGQFAHSLCKFNFLLKGDLFRLRFLLLNFFRLFIVCFVSGSFCRFIWLVLVLVLIFIFIFCCLLGLLTVWGLLSFSFFDLLARFSRCTLSLFFLRFIIFGYSLRTTRCFW